MQTREKAKTLSQTFDMFMAERQHCKASTLRTYRETTRYFMPALGQRDVSELNAHEIAVFRSELACQYAPRTVNKIIGLLKGIVRFAYERGLIEHDKLACIKGVHEPIPEVDPLTIHEFDATLQAVKMRFRPYFALMFWSGMRPSELMALRWKDIDLENGIIEVRRARVRGHEAVPKTRTGRRQIPIFAPAKEALLAQAAYTRSDVHNYVFTTSSGNPITKHMDTMWKRAMERAEVRHRPNYQLRHSFASMLLAAGETPAYVARLMGHSTTETLYRHYARWIPGNKDGLKFQERIGKLSPTPALMYDREWDAPAREVEAVSDERRLKVESLILIKLGRSMQRKYDLHVLVGKKLIDQYNFNLILNDMVARGLVEAVPDKYRQYSRYRRVRTTAS